jgi:hypothetical protein
MNIQLRKGPEILVSKGNLSLTTGIHKGRLLHYRVRVVSRSEILRAHRFVRRRLINAIESGDPDAEPSRGGRAVAVGVAVALASLAAVVAQRYIGDAQPWRRADAVIVERDTDAHFVYLDGVLHPVVNYVSARLALGVAAPYLVTVARDDLRGVPTGSMWGISGAPDAIPSPSDLVTSWSVCSDPDGNGHLVLGESIGGRQAGGLVVRDRSGADYRIVDGRRARIRAHDASAAVPASEFLAAIPVVSHVPDVVGSPAPGPLCAIFDGGPARVVVAANAPGVRVAMPPGRGALVRSTAPSSPVELVVGDVAYPLKDAAAQTSLGLADAAPIAMPPQVIALIPRGIELSTQAARAVIDS